MRVTEYSKPMDSRNFLFIGIQWERGWRYQLKKAGGVVMLEITLADFDHTMAAGESLAAPLVFFGVSAGDADSAFVWLSDISKRLRRRRCQTGLGVKLRHPGRQRVTVSSKASWLRSKRLTIWVWNSSISTHPGTRAHPREALETGVADLGTTKRIGKSFAWLGQPLDAVHAKGMKFGLWIGPKSWIAVWSARLSHANGSPNSTVRTEFSQSKNGRVRVIRFVWAARTT